MTNVIMTVFPFLFTDKWFSYSSDDSGTMTHIFNSHFSAERSSRFLYFFSSFKFNYCCFINNTLEFQIQVKLLSSNIIYQYLLTPIPCIIMYLYLKDIQKNKKSQSLILYQPISVYW